MSGAPEYDTVAHLQMIQGVIARMAQASTNAKSWLLPVVTAAYGYAASQHEPVVAYLGIAAAALFSYIDAEYLRRERAFICLYRAAARGAASGFDMSPNSYLKKTNGTKDPDFCSFGSAYFSWSVGAFYVPIGVVGIIVAVISRPCT